MSKNSSKRGDYEIGYGKPPKYPRFVPGTQATIEDDQSRKTHALYF